MNNRGAEDSAAIAPPLLLPLPLLRFKGVRKDVCGEDKLPRGALAGGAGEGTGKGPLIVSGLGLMV